MNFSGHIAGGVGAGLAAGAVALGFGDELGAHTEEIGGVVVGRAAYGWACFLTALLMSLFPDLDTASIPQRWFLRGMFAALVAALYFQQTALFVVLAFAALLPLIHRHRGWTHWRVTPWLIAFFLAVSHEYAVTRGLWFGSFQWNRAVDLVAAYWPFVFASVLGHYTHLVLDSRSIKWLPFINNPAGHH